MKSSDFDPVKKVAAQVAAAKLREAGFSVMSSGYGSVVVCHNGRPIIVHESDADAFIAKNTRQVKMIEDLGG